VYVLRSKSDDPVVAAHRDVLHKIGVTGGDVWRRIANARLDPTFLMADVEIKDRFGQPITPREWFLVPLFVIDEAVERIKDGTITGYVYDPKTASVRP